MSLRTKFGLMLGVLGLALALSLGAALALGAFLERELTRPFQMTTRALAELSSLERAIDAQTRTLARGTGRSREEARAEYESVAPEVERAVALIEANEEFQTLAGVGATRSLLDHATEAGALARVWFDGGGEEGVRAARGAHEGIQELIARMKQRVLEEANNAVVYGQELRRMHQTVLGASMLSALLAGVLGVALFGRWVLRPIADLRLAATEIAQGEYGHRAPVRAGDEFGLLAGEVNRMAEMIAATQHEAVERERLAAAGALVRRLAHNLRNPLAAIRSLAELTQRRPGVSPQIGKDQSEIVGAVDRFNAWLTELVQANAPLEVVCAEIEPSEWWERVLASQRPLARMRSVELVPDLHPLPRPVRVDGNRLEHALAVLISNAIQASPPDGAVTIRSQWRETEGEWEIEVADDGPGVPDELKEQVFQPYFTTKPDGNGIGLAIARQVVLGHGGSIAVQDRPGAGASFVVRIPLGPRTGQVAADFRQMALSNQGGLC